MGEGSRLGQSIRAVPDPKGSALLLKLKKLELVGFKSFCDRQELPFNGGGVSAVVGPNGCGKSNISDSISWVLGERSAKSLRGNRMQDVIFNGSRDRKPSGMALVSLTLLDPEAHLKPKTTLASNGSNGANRANGVSHGRPAEFTVTRKLFRSGESQYLINGKLCRLRDIQDIFLGTGLGAPSTTPSSSKAASGRSSARARSIAVRSSKRPPASPSSSPANDCRNSSSKAQSKTCTASTTFCRKSRGR